MLSGFEIVSGLADGASVMPANGTSPYSRSGSTKAELAAHRSTFHRGRRRKSHPTATADRWLSPREHFLCCPCVARILRQSSRTTSWQSRKITWMLTSYGADGHAKILAEPGDRSSKAIDARP